MDVPESILAEAFKPLPWQYDLWVHPSAEEKAKALQPSPAASSTASGSRPSRNMRTTQASSSRAQQQSTRSKQAMGYDDEDDDGEDEDDWYDTDDEMEERAQYCGHTRADFEELMCQGFKPWDVLPGDLPWNDL